MEVVAWGRKDWSFNGIIGGAVFDPGGIRRLSHQPLQGFPVTILYRVLRLNCFQVDRSHLDKFLYLAATSLIHSLLNRREKRLFGDLIEATELVAPPVFILGHWRSGTTFLHNLLALDPEFTYPRAFQAFFPGSFLLPHLRQVLKRLEMRIQLKTRPMDNVKFSLYEPWEDEFLIASLTGISPYIRVLFPRTMGIGLNYRYPDFRGQREVVIWRNAFVRLLKRLTVYEGKRLVLKSPPHTARLGVLYSLYPDAKFIYIVRHPCDVFASSLKLWRDAFRLSFLQEIGCEEVVEIVLSTYEQLFERYCRDRKMIPEKNLVELKFEDLEANPFQVMKEIYMRLDLGDFDRVESLIESYLESLHGYRKNVFKITPKVKELVKNRWGKVFDIYDYK